MQIRQERQLNAVADEVLALTAVVRPILMGVLYALKDDVVQQAGGRDNITLALLARLYRAGDGDCGICFEYAVHEAMTRRDPRVVERVNDAIRLCRINGNDPQSILFGLEKSGTLQLIDSAAEMLTEDSRVLAGTVGQPPKLLKHLHIIAGAFRNARTRLALPSSIRGLWKADLVLGYPEREQWVGTSVKINPAQLEGAQDCASITSPIRQCRHGRSSFDSVVSDMASRFRLKRC